MEQHGVEHPCSMQVKILPEQKLLNLSLKFISHPECWHTHVLEGKGGTVGSTEIPFSSVLYASEACKDGLML